MALILAVDDEQDMLEVIAYNLERAGHTVLRADSGKAALAAVEEQTPDLIISDVMMPGMNGLELCSHIRARPQTVLTPFLFVTAKTQVEDKFNGLRAGADDYVTKPFDLPDLLARVDGRLEHRATVSALAAQVERAERARSETFEPARLKQLRAESEALVDRVHEAGHLEFAPPDPDRSELERRVARFEERFDELAAMRNSQLVGNSSSYLRIFEDILIAANSPDPTLILGETGTGKTAVAEAIHALGPRAGGPFRTVNCSELATGDPTIATGKLFGYGAGSGLPNLPKEGQAGLLDEANGGVLFLDEVKNLPPQACALLLLPLEGRPFRPAVGKGPERRVDAKFVLATHHDLAQQVEEGAFPRDLYERMAGEVIRIPPLRERRDDIPLLAEHFLAEAAGDDSPPSIARKALARLCDYSWPGNVRELRRSVRQASRRASLEGRRHIEVADLPDAVKAASPPATVERTMETGPFNERERGELHALRAASFRISDAEAALGYSSRARTLSHRLRGLCFKALAVSNGDISAAAALLAGDRPDNRAVVERRIRSLLDGMREKLDEPDARVLNHLLVEHRGFASTCLERLRRDRECG